MKKLTFLFLIVMLVGLLLQPQFNSYAQAAAATPTPTYTATPSAAPKATLLPVPVNDPNFIDFQTLGQVDRLMNGPYSSNVVRFSQPTSWKLKTGAVLRLDIGAYFSQSAQYNRNGGAALDITLNKVWITTVMINWDGEQTVSIPIPDRALTPALLDGEHSLNMYLDASVDCANNNQTTITIRSTSGFELPHDVISPSTSLAQLPAPFYQVNSFRPDPVTLVVPKNASAEELKAALIVEAAFGRFSNNKMSLPIVASDLVSAGFTPDQIRKGNLIYVGKAAGFADLGQVAFSTAISNGKIQSPAIQTDDGFVELAVSPWDKTKAVLFVGGSSDLGVIKAAQALSSGVLRAGTQPDNSIISDVNASIETPVPATDRSLTDLGYTTSDYLSGFGTVSTGYQFNIPAGMVPGTGAYIDLVYSHSALLDFARSGLVINLNGEAIGSARYTEATSKGTNTLRVGLPASAIRPGVNRIDIESDLIPLDYCSTMVNTGLWVSIFPTTLIHMPLVPAQGQPSFLQPDLSRYPYPFISDPTLASMAFVLPKDDLASLNIAGSIASELGKTANGALINLGAFYGDNVPDAARKSIDFMFIGRASSLPVIKDVNASFPAPFAANSDIAQEQGMRVTYRMPQGTDLGYLQLLSSPWNTGKTILAVMGSSDKGLVWAGNAITDSRWRGRISGNFAVSNNSQVLSSDTRLGVTNSLSATAVVGTAIPVISTDMTQEAPAQDFNTWLIPAIAVTLILIVVLILFVLLSKRKREEPR